MNKKNNKCIDQIGASFGQPIGVNRCYHSGTSQVN